MKQNQSLISLIWMN